MDPLLQAAVIIALLAIAFGLGYWLGSLRHPVLRLLFGFYGFLTLSLVPRLQGFILTWKIPDPRAGEVKLDTPTSILETISLGAGVLITFYILCRWSRFVRPPVVAAETHDLRATFIALVMHHLAPLCTTDTRHETLVRLLAYQITPTQALTTSGCPAIDSPYVMRAYNFALADLNRIAAEVQPQ